MSVKKTDKRILHTKKFIRDALIELMKTKMISQISVLRLCRQADINRNTFYAHYSTPEDVLIEIEDEITSQFNTILKTSNEPQLEILRYLRDISDELTVLCANRSSRLMQKMVDFSAESFERYFRLSGVDSSAIADKALIYVSGGTTSLVNDWIVNGCRESPEIIHEQLTQLDQSVLNSLSPLHE